MPFYVPYCLTQIHILAYICTYTHMFIYIYICNIYIYIYLYIISWKRLAKEMGAYVSNLPRVQFKHVTVLHKNKNTYLLYDRRLSPLAVFLFFWKICQLLFLTIYAVLCIVCLLPCFKGICNLLIHMYYMHTYM